MSPVVSILTGQADLVAPPPAPTDPDFASVVLLTHLDVDPPVDKSLSSHTLTAAAGATLDTVVTKFGAGSYDFDGGADASISTPDSADWDFGSGDFTVEFFARFPSGSINANHDLISQWGGSGARSWILLHAGNQNQLEWFLTTNGTTGIKLIEPGFTAVADTWYHIAVARESATTRIFVDGIEIGSQVDSNTYFDSATALHLGERAEGSRTLNANMDEVRITKGIARYNANFTPPSAPFPDA